MKKLLIPISLMLLSALFAAGRTHGKTLEFQLSSPAVSGAPQEGFDSHLKSSGRLDPQYAAKDNGPANTKSFPFNWKGLPEGTKALALVLDDPDARRVMAAYNIKAKAFLHWIAADIDPQMQGLPADASAGNHSFVQGKNGSGSIGYMGPQPPSDFPNDARTPIIHIYRLKVYALSAPTGLKDGFTLEELLQAIKDKIIGEAHLYISYNN
jgi:hypothetical protein